MEALLNALSSKSAYKSQADAHNPHKKMRLIDQAKLVTNETQEDMDLSIHLNLKTNNQQQLDLNSSTIDKFEAIVKKTNKSDENDESFHDAL